MTIHTGREQYWSGRYNARDTPWDAGTITTPLREFINSLGRKDLRILIPGAGNAYEAEYLHRQGFNEVYVADISPVPLRTLSERCPDFPPGHLLCQDFFTLEGQYDLILEQTFFCAIHPSLRTSYVDQSLALLRPGGRLAGVLFDDPLFTDHPPYGGTMEEYASLFLPFFACRVMERCYNSIPPRDGREIFIDLQKPGGVWNPVH